MDIEPHCLKTLSLAVWLAISQAACAQQQPLLPEEVSRYVARRELCEHLRGEIPDVPDASLIQQINEACKGVDTELTRLSAEFAQNPQAMSALAGYKRNLERSSP